MRDLTDTGFEALGVTEEPVTRVARELLRAGYRTHRAPDGFEVAIPEALVGRALRWGRESAPNEWYGLVVGVVGRDERGSHVVVHGIVLDEDAVTTPGSAETTHASEWRTRRLARAQYPDCVIVGWAHGHHRVGVHFSGRDRQNQRSWTQAHHLGLVFDPWDDAELAVYRGPDSELAPRVAGGGAGDDTSFSAVTCALQRPKARRPRLPSGVLHRFAALAGTSLVTVALVALCLAGGRRTEAQVARMERRLSDHERLILRGLSRLDDGRGDIGALAVPTSAAPTCPAPSLPSISRSTPGSTATPMAEPGASSESGSRSARRGAP